jgi:hypothetical protein
MNSNVAPDAELPLYEGVALADIVLVMSADAAAEAAGMSKRTMSPSSFAAARYARFPPI